MATIIEVTDSKLECMSECVEKMLKHGGKLMTLLEELSSEGKYGMKSRRNGYEEDDEYENRYKLERRSGGMGSGGGRYY